MAKFNTYYNPDHDSTERLYDEPEEPDAGGLEITIMLGIIEKPETPLAQELEPRLDPYLHQDYDPKYFVDLDKEPMPEPETPEDLLELLQSRMP